MVWAAGVGRQSGGVVALPSLHTPRNEDSPPHLTFISSVSISLARYVSMTW